MQQGIIVNRKKWIAGFITVGFVSFAFAVENISFKKKEKSIDQIANELISEISDQVKKKYNLQLVASGGGGVYGLDLLTLDFTGYSEYFISEMREVLIDISLQFLDIINASKEFEKRLACFPFSGDNINVMVGFIREDYTRPKKPFIALAFTVDGKIYYRFDGNEKKPFEDAGEETFEEALAIVANSQNLELSKRTKEYLLSHAK